MPVHFEKLKAYWRGLHTDYKSQNPTLIDQTYPSECAMEFVSGYCFTRADGDNTTADYLTVALEIIENSNMDQVTVDGVFYSKANNKASKDYQARQIYNCIAAARFLEREHVPGDAHLRFRACADHCIKAIIDNKLATVVDHPCDDDVNREIFYAAYSKTPPYPPLVNAYVDTNQDAQLGFALAMACSDPLSTYVGNERLLQLAFASLDGSRAAQLKVDSTDPNGGAGAIRCNDVKADAMYTCYDSFYDGLTVMMWILGYRELQSYTTEVAKSVEAAARWLNTPPLMDPNNGSFRCQNHSGTESLGPFEVWCRLFNWKVSGVITDAPFLQNWAQVAYNLEWPALLKNTFAATRIFPLLKIAGVTNDVFIKPD